AGVDEVGDDFGELVESFSRQGLGRRWLGVDQSIPGGDRLEPGQEAPGNLTVESSGPRVILLSRPAARHVDRGVKAAAAVKDFDVMSQDEKPGGQADLIA